MSRKEHPFVWYYNKNLHFAELINGWLFRGRDRLTADDISDSDRRILTRKGRNRYKDRFRDLCKSIDGVVFRLLIGVSGVGPKAALAILSEAPPSKLALSIITGDAKLLMQAPGIGKKIAQRIVLELRDKMSSEQQDAPAAGLPAPALAQQPKGSVNHTQEAVAALLVLGYTQAEAFAAMEGCPADGASAEDMIRYCLKRLAGGK